MATLAPALAIGNQMGATARRQMGINRTAAWTALWLAMGAAAAYVLAPQAGALVESIEALQRVNPVWVLAGAGLVAARYTAAAVSLAAAAGTSLRFTPTLMVQLATSFAGRLTPEGIGWLMLNQRYLEKTGLARSSAAAALALRIVAGGIVRVVIVAIVAVLVGRNAFAGFELATPWPILLLGIGAGALVVGSIAYALRGRAPRLTASLRTGAAGIADALRDPRRAAALFGGSTAVTASYVLTLAVSVAAFGAQVPFLELFAMYLAATAVAAASPTPGNLGALELALAGGLGSLGIGTGNAVAAVLVFRLLTFWLPLLPGFLAFRYLQRGGHL